MIFSEAIFQYLYCTVHKKPTILILTMWDVSCAAVQLEAVHSSFILQCFHLVTSLYGKVKEHHLCLNLTSASSWSNKASRWSHIFLYSASALEVNEDLQSNRCGVWYRHSEQTTEPEPRICDKDLWQGIVDMSQIVFDVLARDLKSL